MRKPSTYCLLFLFLFLCYTLSSCTMAKKNKDKRIVGAWNVVNVIEQDPNTVRQWEFLGDGTVKIRQITDSSVTIVDAGTWAIEQKTRTAFLNAEFGSIQSTQNGISVLWEILSLKKKTMYLTHQDGGLITREFERAQ